MDIRLTGSLLFVAALAGCKAAEGVYEPGCPAHEGMRIEFRDGAVVWDRFTDEVHVDADGNAIDPFPGYPRHGSYEIAAQVVTVRLGGEPAEHRFHLVERDGAHMLLTEAQQIEYRRSGSLDACVLTRSGQT